MRTQSTQLPSYIELCKILSSEANRKIPFEKKNIDYTDFSSIIKLLKYFNLPTNFFDSYFRFIDFKNPILFKEINLMFTNLINNILKTQNDTSKKYYDELYDYLSESDQIQNSDIIFVFGSNTTFRIEKAIKLYKNGYSSKILISGKRPFYEQINNIIPEARRLADFALSNGVPEGDLILEKESITIPDNVKSSLNMLENKNIPHNSIILVNSPFSQRRGWVNFNQFSVNGTKLIRCNVDIISEKYSKDGWYKNEVGVKTIIKEFISLRMGEIVKNS